MGKRRTWPYPIQEIDDEHALHCECPPLCSHLHGGARHGPGHAPGSPRWRVDRSRRPGLADARRRSRRPPRRSRRTAAPGGWRKRRDRVLGCRPMPPACSGSRAVRASSAPFWPNPCVPWPGPSGRWPGASTRWRAGPRRAPAAPRVASAVATPWQPEARECHLSDGERAPIARCPDPFRNGAPGWDRTSNPCLRRAVLYPLSYRRERTILTVPKSLDRQSSACAGGRRCGLERPGHTTTIRARPPSPRRSTRVPAMPRVPAPASPASPSNAYCAIDFGTSNSAIAIADASGAMQLVELEPGHRTMPTAVFYLVEGDESQGPPRAFGRAAIAAYVDGLDGRLMRSMKSILGSSLVLQTTDVGGGRGVKYLDVIAGYLKHLKTLAEAQTGAPISRAVLGRPVFFVDDDPARDAQAQAALDLGRAGGRLQRTELPVRADRRRVRIRAHRAARADRAGGRHRRWHVGLRGRARRPRSRDPAGAQGRHPRQPRRARRRHRFRPPHRACLPAGRVRLRRLRADGRRHAAARGAERGVLRPGDLAPDQHRVQPAARGRAARHAQVLRRAAPSRAPDDGAERAPRPRTGGARRGGQDCRRRWRPGLDRSRAGRARAGRCARRDAGAGGDRRRHRAHRRRSADGRRAGPV